ncbi:MAG: CsgE family curli-type amyloid fiber assembly protein [Methylococcales bacterium]
MNNNRKYNLTYLLALLWIIYPLTSLSENKSLIKNPVDSVTQVDPVFEFGLILDETISKPGADFFEIFYLYWQPETDEVINLRIQEQPGLFRANFILLWLDDELIIRQQLPQRYDDIESLVKITIEQLNRQLLDNLFIQKQLDY